MARVTIHYDVIQRMKDEMQASFDRGGALQVQVEASGPNDFSPAGATDTALFMLSFLLWLDRQPISKSARLSTCRTPSKPSSAKARRPWKQKLRPQYPDPDGCAWPPTAL